nr:pro-resilin-like [Penaeus vannamei]
MNAKVLLLVCLAAVVAADSFESAESGEYNFNWAVKHDDSGNDFGHQEARNGDNTQGSYYVQPPDGRLQTVRYVVGRRRRLRGRGQLRGRGSLPRLQ